MIDELASQVVENYWRERSFHYAQSQRVFHWDCANGRYCK